MWCATGVNLSGGVTKDGGAIIGASVFYNNNLKEQNNKDPELETRIDENIEMKKLDKELKVVIILNDLYLFIDINYIILGK